MHNYNSIIKRGIILTTPFSVAGYVDVYYYIFCNPQTTTINYTVVAPSDPAIDCTYNVYPITNGREQAVA